MFDVESSCFGCQYFNWKCFYKIAKDLKYCRICPCDKCFCWYPSDESLNQLKEQIENDELQPNSCLRSEKW